MTKPGTRHSRPRAQVHIQPVVSHTARHKEEAQSEQTSKPPTRSSRLDSTPTSRVPNETTRGRQCARRRQKKTYPIRNHQVQYPPMNLQQKHTNFSLSSHSSILASNKGSRLPRATHESFRARQYIQPQPRETDGTVPTPSSYHACIAFAWDNQT